MSNNTQEYVITEATIFAERFAEEYNLTKYLGELSFFEDIERPYVTAQVVMMDDIGVFDEIKIRGSEQMRLTVQSVATDTVPVMSFTIILNIVSIIQADKVGERSEVYHLNLISPHAFRDANKKISRSYTGKLEDIAAAVLQNHLGVGVDYSYIGSWGSMQGPVKVIIPYISPLETVEWLLSRATTLTGCPIYCWQTIYDQVDGKDNVRFGSLEYMMNVSAFNYNSRFRYSTSAANAVADKGLSEQSMVVKNLRVENIQDNLKMIHEGAIGSNLTNIDTYTSQEFERHFDITEQLDALDKLNVIPYGSNQNVFDADQTLEFEGETKAINEWDARQYNTITSYGTYGAANSYHDVQDPSEALNKLRVRAVKSMFNKTMFDIVIPGIAFFSQLANGNSGVSAGDTLYIDFLNSDVDDDGAALNDDLSGKYLIHRCRNIFRDTSHEIVCTISKLATNEPKIV
jgi:hypothetical protein